MDIAPEAKETPRVLDVVAMLAPAPAKGIGRGQVGTVVEDLSGGKVLVEFADDNGRAYAIEPCMADQLLILRYVPDTA